MRKSFRHYATIVLSVLILSIPSVIFSQEIPITNYTVGPSGQPVLEVESNDSSYYLLQAKHNLLDDDYSSVSVKKGNVGSTELSEPLAAYPESHYRILEYSMKAPIDIDGDGIDDITELDGLPFLSPLNAAHTIDPSDGLLAIDSLSSYKRLSIQKENVQFSEFLNGLSFVKYMITDFHTDQPKVFFIESNKHNLHSDFAATIGVEGLGDNVRKGQIIYHPTSISNSGKLGNYTFNYSNGKGQDFSVVQRTYELLAANMPFIENNLSYFVTELSEEAYARDEELFINSRVHVIFEADLFSDVDYWGLNFAEGYGFFRNVGLDEIPGPREIVLYETLPNELPRVGGVITSVIQTPLSHVNLRAIQNDIPNAFIRNPLLIDSIADLLNKNIYYKVEQDKYVIREATSEEVNLWYDNIRPSQVQVPPLNLSYSRILPLEEVDFHMYDGFGAKAANVATMRTFGFPDGTIPGGFAIPFYYYQEFIRYNNLSEHIKAFINDEDFLNNRALRSEVLSEFRELIKDSDMPSWMMDDLSSLQSSFSPGTSIRCRSSTNNEDLPNFNGAGLYASRTQHPDEGHISKSIKQVYASLWNLRAFDEREFYRIDHFFTSMGVLCHPNYSDELANGVGVSIDPLYNTKNTFYLNTQVGEELITNPGSNTIPEEILLERAPQGDNDRIIIQRSNLTDDGSLIMEDHHLQDMRSFLTIIHNEFKILYKAEGNEDFAMDIEYKITKDEQLIIKQARPWVSALSQAVEAAEKRVELYDFLLYPIPSIEYVTVEMVAHQFEKIQIYSSDGALVIQKELRDNITQLDVSSLANGIYYVIAIYENQKQLVSKVLLKQ